MRKLTPLMVAALEDANTSWARRVPTTYRGSTLAGLAARGLITTGRAGATRYLTAAGAAALAEYRPDVRVGIDPARVAARVERINGQIAETGDAVTLSAETVSRYYPDREDGHAEVPGIITYRWTCDVCGATRRAYDSAGEARSDGHHHAKECRGGAAETVVPVPPPVPAPAERHPAESMPVIGNPALENECPRCAAAPGALCATWMDRPMRDAVHPERKSDYTSRRPVVAYDPEYGWSIDGGAPTTDFTAVHTTLTGDHGFTSEDARTALDTAEMNQLNAVLPDHLKVFASMGGFGFTCQAGRCHESRWHDTPDDAAMSASRHRASPTCTRNRTAAGWPVKPERKSDYTTRRPAVDFDGTGEDLTDWSAYTAGRGLSPEHAEDAAGRAATAALAAAGLALVDMSAAFDPADESTSTGYLVVPRPEYGPDRVYVYYLTRGRTMDPATGGFPREQLRKAHRALSAAGWGVDDSIMRCVHARRPAAAAGESPRPAVAFDADRGWSIDGGAPTTDFTAVHTTLTGDHGFTSEDARTALDTAEMNQLNAVLPDHLKVFASMGGFGFTCQAGRCHESRWHDTPDDAAMSASRHRASPTCTRNRTAAD